MPNKGKAKRKFRRYLAGKIKHILQLGTLATVTGVSGVVADSVTEKAWLTSVKATWSLIRYTVGVNDGPIMVGLAHSDYSTAEIEEWIENLGSWEEGDQVSQEKGKRKIRQVGVFDDAGINADVPDTMNDGKPITTKCGWQLATGQTVRIWAYNLGTSALATTDPEVHVNGHANLWPN